MRINRIFLFSLIFSAAALAISAQEPKPHAMQFMPGRCLRMMLALLSFSLMIPPYAVGMIVGLNEQIN